MVALDCHVHLWSRRDLDYPWLAAVPALREQYLPADYEADGGADGVVFVEAGARADLGSAEAQWVNSLEWPRLRGIVAGATPTDPELATSLDALRRTPKVVGVRFNVQQEPVEFLAASAVSVAAALVAERDLSLDVCIRHQQMTALVDLAERVPEARLVLDHLGKPPLSSGIESAAGAAWWRALMRLAALPNTYVKLSGLPGEGGTAEFTAHADEYLAAGIEAFGTERVLLASDWPVSTTVGAAVPLSDWAARVRRLVPRDSEWMRVSATNGARVYKLDG